MPPVHPAIVHFPIALVTLSFIADLLGSWLNKPTLRITAFWSLGAAFRAGMAARWSSRREPALLPPERELKNRKLVGDVLTA